MAYDYSKLLGRIVEKFKTQANFAKVAGISEHSLSVKLNTGASFKQKQIDKMCELLDIPKEQIGIYFFTYRVQSI